MGALAVDKEGLISFDDLLDITMVADRYEQLSQLLNEHKSILINAENIERIDGAGLQLLTAFFKEAKSLNISLEWQSCSEALKNSAKLSGLTENLGL
ncbi:MAG: STAS domain-containing protein [gamma proteobacterium symbiont of Taylorina sp.]|nr:STAS domain-containing protein [gamma proteobacterium symbiont of Taylorina sp.]